MENKTEAQNVFLTLSKKEFDLIIKSLESLPNGILAMNDHIALNFAATSKDEDLYIKMHNNAKVMSNNIGRETKPLITKLKEQL
jgi:hypothetical protein